MVIDLARRLCGAPRPHHPSAFLIAFSGEERGAFSVRIITSNHPPLPARAECHDDQLYMVGRSIPRAS